MTDRETESILALTTRTLSAQHLQGFFQQSGRRANAETASKLREQRPSTASSYMANLTFSAAPRVAPIFHDARRWKIELNQPESPLRLLPWPGLLQNGCNWQSVQTMLLTHRTHRKVRSARKRASRRPAQQKVKKIHLRAKYRSLLVKVMQRNPQPLPSQLAAQKCEK